MKKILFSLLVTGASAAYAGGTVGGNPGLKLEMLDAAFSVQSLPKTYADQDDFRRAAARLGEAGTVSTELAADGEKIQVRKLGNSIVDNKLSTEILPQ